MLGYAVYVFMMIRGFLGSLSSRPAKCFLRESLTFGGLQGRIKKVTLLGRTKHRLVKFVQQGTRVMVTGLPRTSPDPVCPVLRFDCDRPPSVYQTGGLRIPNVKHPHYDPVQPDIKY